MPIPSIHNFISEVVRPGNFARQYNYTVSFTSPLGPLRNPTQGMLLRCESIAFPGQNISTSNDNLRIGPLRDHASNVTYGDLTAIFLCSDDLSERKFFEEWQPSLWSIPRRIARSVEDLSKQWLPARCPPVGSIGLRRATR